MVRAKALLGKSFYFKNFCTLLRFLTFYEMSLQENIEKNLCPLMNHSGGGIFAAPPPELLRQGTILRGRDSPTPEITQGGGHTPFSTPCIRSCMYIYIYIYVVL